MRSADWPGDWLFEDDLLPIFETKEPKKKGAKKKKICQNEQNMHNMFSELPSAITTQPEL